MISTTTAFHSIQHLLQQSAGDSDVFVESLRHESIPHLSYSQISTVEFCEYRYYLQYILMKDPDPLPDYFTKGKLFHRLVASFYQNGKHPLEAAFLMAQREISTVFKGENQRHLENAFMVHLENYWCNCEVIAVEQPFVMLIDSGLPPCVGVIDLVMRKNGTVILVDHKTGGDFYEDDELQMAMYQEYVHQEFGHKECVFYYDHYRWVNNLNRIRKPAFQRTQVSRSGRSWQYYLSRVREGYNKIDRIKTSHRAVKQGQCFRCPYRRMCYGTY